LAIALTGYLIIRVEDEEIDIPAKAFILSEEDDRNIGDGDTRYEALYIYFDKEDRFKIQMQATQFEGKIQLWELEIHRPSGFEGLIEILDDQIDGVACKEE